MKTDMSLELIKNIADLYYNGNLTQSEIAHRYNISRPKVSRLLAEARENGIVKIFIDGRNETSRFQEEQLLKRYPLKAVKVISVPYDDDQLALQITAQETATFFSGFFNSNDRIGISWGYTLYTMTRYFPNLSLDDISIYQIVGHIDNTSTRNHASEIIDLMGQRLHTKNAFIFPCPAVFDSPLILEMLLHDSKLKKLYESMLQCNKLIVSLAPSDTSCCLYRSGYINQGDLDLMNQCGSVGSICCHFIDQNGKLCDEALDQRTLAIPLDVLKSKEYLFSYVTNAEKVPVLHAALKAGYINVLSIDSISARILLES